jgi:hypothetical protein
MPTKIYICINPVSFGRNHSFERLSATNSAPRLASSSVVALHSI